jgi:hypothetical protein
MPRHPRAIQYGQRVTCVIKHVLEIHDPRVIVVLARKERSLEGGGMDVGERMVVGVPTPETEVESADAGEVVVDHDDLCKMESVLTEKDSKGKNLLMVRPKLDTVYEECRIMSLIEET